MYGKSDKLESLAENISTVFALLTLPLMSDIPAGIVGVRGVSGV